MNIVRLENLSKKYKDFTAVDNISLSIDDGQIYGILGPNGAGKSTTINMICNMIYPSSGNIYILNENIKNNFKNIKRNIGLVPQNIAVYDKFTAQENVHFFASLQGLKGNQLNKAVERALEFTGLTQYRDREAHKYSGGMLRRLNIACAIVHSPKLIIMDEPTVGIDPQSRNHILESIKTLNKEGATILYCSHYMEEVEQICSKIAIIDHGKVTIEGTNEEIKKVVNTQRTLLIKLDSYKHINIDELTGIDGVISAVQDDTTVTIINDSSVKNLNRIINYFDSKDIQLVDIGYSESNLETVFLTLTGKKLRD